MKASLRISSGMLNWEGVLGISPFSPVNSMKIIIKLQVRIPLFRIVYFALGEELEPQFIHSGDIVISLQFLR